MVLKNRHLQRYLPPWLIIALIIILSIIGPLSTDMYLPGLMMIVEEFATTEAILNITLYGFLFTQSLAILVLGPASDKYGRKPVLLASIVVYIVSSLLCGMAGTIELFIALRLIQGAATGGLMVIATALIKDCFAEAVRNRVLTMTMVFTIIGPLLAPIIGAQMIEYISWQSTLIAPGFVTVPALIIALFLCESRPEEDRLTGSIPQVIGHMFTLCRHRGFTLFLVSMGILTLPFMTYLAISSYIYTGTFGTTSTTYSLILAANIVIGTAGMLVLQLVGKKAGMRTEGRIILGLVLLSGILMVLFGHTGPLACLLCFTPCAIGVITARPYGLNVLLQEFEHDTGSVSALFNFSLMFLGCIGMILGTLPWSSYISGLAVCILLGAGIGIAAWLLLRASGMKLKGLRR